MCIAEILMCRTCGWEQEFLLGINGDEYPFRNSLRFLSPRQRALILERVEIDAVPFWAYGTAIYRCPGCTRLVERFAYDLRARDGTRLRPTYRCGRCRARLVPFTGSLRGLPCPRCSKTSLSFRHDDPDDN